MAHELGIAFVNAAGAFENPMTAAAWWGSVREAALSRLPLSEDTKPRFDAALTARLRALQEAASGAISRGASAPDLAVLSEALACATMQLRGDPPVLVHAVSDGTGAVLFPLAHAVAALLADRRRLRTCANAECSAYFWDTTKNGSRRWCRLSCMERARAPRRRLQR
jgi:predicted RNA-binding Zn ribbon-like protein